MTTTPVRMDPRIRERRIAVKRALGRRRLRIAVVVLGLVLVLAVAALTVFSPLLDVDTIRVVGARHTGARDVRRASGIHVHDALLFVDEGAAAHRLERLPWVERATVHRDFPGTVRIVVDEYTPTAYVRAGDQIVLFAENGHAIAHAHDVPAGAVEVRGVRRPPADGELLSPPEAAGVAPQLPADLRARVTAVDVSGDGIALVLQGGGAIRLGDADNLDAKAAAALAVLNANGSACFSYVDVSTPATPVLRRCQ